MFAPRTRGMKGEILELPEGYAFVKGAKTNHVSIICPDGEKLRMPTGIPLSLALTPSDNRTRSNERARIKTALRARGEDV